MVLTLIGLDTEIPMLPTLPYLKVNRPLVNITHLTWILSVKRSSNQLRRLKWQPISAGQARNAYRQAVNTKNCVGQGSFIYMTHCLFADAVSVYIRRRIIWNLASDRLHLAAFQKLEFARFYNSLLQ